MHNYQEELERTVALIEELENQSDRAAAIILAAWVEEELLGAIKSKLEKDDSIFKKLFYNSGPLSSFSAKIDIAKALGIYDSEIYSDLNIIRRIRNEFAHEILDKNNFALSFESKHIRDRALSLKVSAYEKHSEPRIAYTRGCVILFADFNLFALAPFEQIKPRAY
jgi:hypothetical protein